MTGSSTEVERSSLEQIIELESVSITKTAVRWVAGRGTTRLARMQAPLGTLQKSRSQSELGVWRVRA